MATSSIFKSVSAKDKASIRKLVAALERSEASKGADVQMSRTVSEFTKEQIVSIFGDDNDRVSNREP